MSAQPSPTETPSSSEFIAWFETLGNADVARVGGKNASLGEMVQRLAPQGVRVPEGFATAAAYRAYVEVNGFADFLVEQGIDSISLNPDSFATVARHVALTEKRLATSVKASKSPARTG
jgi:pyruvate,water dikinase